MPPKKQPMAIVPSTSASTRGFRHSRAAAGRRAGAAVALGCRATAVPKIPTSNAAVIMASAGEASAVIRLTAAGPST